MKKMKNKKSVADFINSATVCRFYKFGKNGTRAADFIKSAI